MLFGHKDNMSGEGRDIFSAWAYKRNNTSDLFNLTVKNTRTPQNIPYIWLDWFFNGFSTFYVDGSSGNNINDGVNWQEAFAEIVKAEEMAIDNDVVNVKSGTYNEPSSSNGSSGVITFAKTISWTADNGSGVLGTVFVKAKSGAVGPAMGNGSFNGFIFSDEPISINTTQTQNEPVSIGTPITVVEPASIGDTFSNTEPSVIGTIYT
jgi:hypothetical protein